VGDCFRRSANAHAIEMCVEHCKFIELSKSRARLEAHSREGLIIMLAE
jgi:hypothetical protein